MATLSTHVLDTSRGRPASGIRVSLESESGEQLGQGVTDDDGRIADLASQALPDGVHRLRFDTGGYFAERSVDGFYPEVVVTFTLSGDEHFHVPLLLNPFGFSTYRGS